MLLVRLFDSKKIRSGSLSENGDFSVLSKFHQVINQRKKTLNAQPELSTFEELKKSFKR